MGSGVCWYVSSGGGWCVGSGAGWYEGSGVCWYVGSGVGWYVGSGVGWYVGSGVGWYVFQVAVISRGGPPASCKSRRLLLCMHLVVAVYQNRPRWLL